MLITVNSGNNLIHRFRNNHNPFPQQSLKERFAAGAVQYIQRETRSAGKDISTCKRVGTCLFSVGVGLPHCGWNWVVQHNDISCV
jgi:hypothetical protein